MSDDPYDIPDDIMDAARRCHDQIMSNPSTESTAVFRIARAIRAERERCANLLLEEADIKRKSAALKDHDPDKTIREIVAHNLEFVVARIRDPQP